ncbi:MAG: single-stranded-DNA-specific exonuclease RecJ [Gaiellaceae bacterium]
MPPQNARWTCRPYDTAAADAVASALGLSRTVAAILVRRGFGTPDAARRFLAAEDRHDPFAFAGMDAVCDRVLGHVARGSRIVVHGDYDVDGVSSTALLVRMLRRLGADVSWHLPSRDDGYGLSIATVERLAARGTGLLLTADCGITAADEVDAALARGMDVVVTDHHRPAERLPDCPIVHPAVCGYPCVDLCAAGVALKLAEALTARAGADPAPLEEDLDLVALATVADVVALLGENRRLVRAGLRELSRTRKPGLRALMKVASVKPGAFDAHAVCFRLAPRINAAGRLQRADAPLELLLTEDAGRAAEIADELDLLNRERQDTETRILFAAEAERTAQADAPAYVLAGEGWHPGVIGIVASRMVERYHRPCVLIALDGDSGRGSGRSISAYDLHAGLAACSAHLRRFGGHRAAAGLEVEGSRVDAFRSDFVAHAAASLSPEDLVPVERVDAVVGAEALGAPLAEELLQLAPFGHRNSAPTLLVPAARVSDIRSMGEEGQHSRFTLAGGGARARTLAFRTAAGSLARVEEGPCDAAVRLELGEWNGLVEPRVVLRALCPTEPASCEVLGEPEFWPAFARALEGSTPDLTGRGREVRDRRGSGFAGVAGDLLSTGEGVAVVCADVPRRLGTLEQALAGAAERCGGRLAAVPWDALRADPGVARSYGHLVALDPPLAASDEQLLAAAPCDVPGGLSHLAWGAAEMEFALAVADARLDLAGPLAEVYRGLREGAELEAVLRGSGRYPRDAFECANLVRVLVELDLVRIEGNEEGFTCRVVASSRTELERSATYRACSARLAEARRRLAAREIAA